MTRADADDAARLTRWVREHGRAVLGFLAAAVRDRDAAEDLLQETFARAWRARSRYADAGDGTRTERADLIRIADRLAQDRFRRFGSGSRRRGEVQVDEAEWDRIEPHDARGPAAWENLERDDARQMLDVAMGALSEAQRRTLLLRYYGDLSFEEIAAMIEAPVNTVLSHCHRGLRAMRRLLAERPS